MPEDLTEFRRWILAVLDGVGADSIRQIRYLRSVGVGVDELVLELDDAVVTAQAKNREGLLGQEELRLIERVGEHVDALPPSPGPLWTESALGEAAQWRELREAAAQAHAALTRMWADA
ncbi:hypothetical protein [Umezawaea sp.]|uniref:hypothetical protein n=1 Tax=Umezawaea sp. TaxID=1955258 RepID=UPI002ED5CA70